jgi:hypothetical protein
VSRIESTLTPYAVSRMRTDHHCASQATVVVHDGFSRRPLRLTYKRSGHSRKYRWASQVAEFCAHRMRPRGWSG